MFLTESPIIYSNIKSNNTIKTAEQQFAMSFIFVRKIKHYNIEM